MSLDSVSPDVVFTKLEQHSLILVSSKQRYKIDVGELRQGKDYELEVVAENRTGGVFRALKAHTSCNCLVGATDGGTIEMGGKGSIILRFSTRKEVFQQNVTIENDGDPVQLEITGKIVPEFVVSPQRVDVNDALAGFSFEISFAPQYADIDISSVSVASTSGLLSSQVIARDPKEIKVLFTLDRSMKSDIENESIEVRFTCGDKETKEVRESYATYSLMLRSNMIVARPSIVRLSHEGASQNTFWRGEVRIYNLPKEDGGIQDKSIEIRIGENLIMSCSVVEWIETKSMTRIIFEIDASFVYQRVGDWTINWRGHGDETTGGPERRIMSWPVTCLWVQFCNFECEQFQQSMRCTNAPWAMPLGGLHIDPMGPCE